MAVLNAYARTNFGQVEPLKITDKVEDVVKEMLYCAGY
jgi:hypothetical protein